MLTATIAIKIRKITSNHTCCIFKVLKSTFSALCLCIDFVFSLLRTLYALTHQLVERKYMLFSFNFFLNNSSFLDIFFRVELDSLSRLCETCTFIYSISNGIYTLLLFALYCYRMGYVSLCIRMWMRKKFIFPLFFVLLFFSTFSISISISVFVYFVCWMGVQFHFNCPTSSILMQFISTCLNRIFYLQIVYKCVRVCEYSSENFLW